MKFEWHQVWRPRKLRSVHTLTQAQLHTFAERGYLILPRLLTSPDLEYAEAEVDRLIAEVPPPDGHADHFFYWPRPAESPILFELLAWHGGILDAATELTGSGGIEVAFDQAQVALNIPPHPHRPGRPHIDGYRAEPTRPARHRHKNGHKVIQDARQTNMTWRLRSCLA